MAGFFTVTLRRKQIVTSYDKKGNPTGTKEAFLEEKHSGLPARTAATYRERFPDAVVAVTREEASFVPQRSRASSVRHRERPVTHTRLDTGLAGREIDRSAKREAITGGTYADAITKAAAREARP